MRIKRIFTMALATAVFVQSLGTSAYAASIPVGVGIGAVSENEMVSLETEKIEELTISENEIVPDETAILETESVEEIAVEEEIEISVEETAEEEFSVMESTESEILESITEDVSVIEIIDESAEAGGVNAAGDYLLDTSLGVTLKDVEVNPGSYHLDVSWISLADWSAWEYYGDYVSLLYTDSVELGNAFFAESTYATDEEINNQGYKCISSSDYSGGSLDQLDENYTEEYNCEKWEVVYLPEDLKQDTTYYYRLVYEYEDDDGETIYKFLTVPDTFTTKAKVETSAITFKDIHVEKTGYGSAKLVWTIENPNNEYIINSRVYYADKEQEFTSSAYEYANEYWDEDSIIPDQYYAVIPLSFDKVKAKIQYTVYTGDRVKTPVESEETVIQRIAIDTATITHNVEATSATINMHFSITPCYSEAGLSLGFYYREKTEDNRYTYKDCDASLLYGSPTIGIHDLKGNTTYEYYLQIFNSDNAVIWSDGSSDAPHTITTKETVIYEDSDFPDEVFREAVREAAEIEEGEAITSDRVESITGLYLSVNDLGKEIKSIEGIQYLINLTSVDFGGQSIADASQLEKLERLAQIYMGSNDLTDMPDFSKHSILTELDLDNNLIPNASITEDKLPEIFWDYNDYYWINNTQILQRGELSWEVPDIFYAIEDEYPFFVSIKNVKLNRNYTLSVTIDGKTTSITENPYGRGCLVIPDLQTIIGSASGNGTQWGEYDASISVVDEFGNEYLSNEAVSFILKGDIAFSIGTKDYSSNFSGGTKVCNIPGYISESDIQKAELVDKSGNPVGVGKIKELYQTDIEVRYLDIYPDIYWEHTQITFDIICAQYLSNGEYDFKVTLQDGTVYTLDNEVCVSLAPFITLFGIASGYDNWGEYIHFQVDGKNLDTDKIYPVLYFDGEAITGEVISVLQRYSGQYIYKVQKINKEDIWDKAIDGKCKVEFVTAEGYSVENKWAGDSITFNGSLSSDLILHSQYNYKKQLYEIFLDSSIPEGTEVSVGIYKTVSANSTLEATATATVKDNCLALAFVRENGEAYIPGEGYIPQANIYRKFKLQYELNGEVKNKETIGKVIWYNYDSYTSDSSLQDIYSYSKLYQESMMKELGIDIRIAQSLVDSTKDLHAQIYTADGTEAGDVLTLSKSAITIAGKDYYKYIGTWKDAIGLDEGVYSIEYSQDDVIIKTDTLYVYDNSKFYTYFQTAVVEADDRMRLDFASEQLYGNYVNKYNENVSDAKALEIWNNTYNLEVFDIFGNKVTGWKIDSVSYEQYYMHVHVANLPKASTGFYFKITDKTGNPAVQLSNGQVFYDENSDSTIELGKWGSKDLKYVYASEDFELQAYYGLRTNYVDGFEAVLTFTKPYDSTVIKKVEVKCNSDRYNFTTEDLSGLDSNEIYRLSITSSGETTNYVGYFAVKSDYTISNKTLTLDLSAENTSGVLTINNGAEKISAVTWSSQDSSVATVDKNGKVTAVGVGSTVITGSVKNGPTFTCEVTVERSALESISLSMDKMELDKGMSKALTVYYLPNDATCEKTIVWTSSDEAVATVDENGVVSAVAKGSAVITATVKDTDKSAQCNVKVFDTVDETLLAIPTGLRALTNVHKTLGDVSLKAFDGWDWRNEDKTIELSKFSGVKEKTFIAYYQKDKDTRPVYKPVTVKLSTIKGINLQAENSSVLVGEDANVELSWNVTGVAYDLSAYEDEIVWKSKKPSVATVSGNGTSVSVNAVSKGKTTIEASVMVGEKTYTAKTNINVLEGKTAQIKIASVSGMTQTAEGSGVYTGNKSTLTSGMIVATLTDADKLTVKSNNTKVITVKKATKNEDGTFSIPYEVKAAGTAKILLTVNDALKTTKEIVLKVKDINPSISTTTVKVNRLLKTGTSIDVYPGLDAPIQDIKLEGTDSALFVTSYDKTTNKFQIVTVDETADKGKYTQLSLKIIFEEEDIEVAPIPFVVKVEAKEPSFNVKQSKKVNLFMDKDVERAKLNVTSSDKVVSMKLENTEDEKFAFEIKQVDGIYYVVAKENGLTTKAAKKGTLTVTFENYRGEYTSNFTVGLERKAPKFTVDSKNYVLYPEAGINEAKVKLYLNKEAYFVNAEDITLVNAKGYDYEVEGNEIIITRTDTNQNSNVKATLEISNENWAEAVPVLIKLSVNKKTPKVKLSKTFIQLNPNVAAYDTSTVKVMWKDGAVFNPYKVTVSAANKASQAVLNKEIRFVINEDQIIAKLNNVKSAKAAYKFKVNVIPQEGAKEISSSVTVKVVPTEITKAVKVSVKGNIDVLNREESYVTVTPSMKGINGKVTKAEISGAFAHLFEEPIIKDGKVYIYAKEDVSLITKYDYPVTLQLSLENDEGKEIEVPASTIKIRCKQGKVKITATPKSALYYSNSYNSASFDLSAILKGAPNPQIEAVELMNESKAFVSSYDVENQRVTVTMKDNGEVVKGKSYNLQFKVTLVGQADNEKATVVKYKVTVK